MRIGLINLLLPKIHTVSAVAERGIQSYTQASDSAMLTQRPDVFIKQASHQPQIAQTQTFMQRPNAAKETIPKEKSPKKQKPEPTPEKPIILTKGGGFVNLSKMIAELQKKLAEIQNTQKSLIQEILSKPDSSLIRSFQQAIAQEERLKSKLDEVLRRHGTKIPMQVITLKPNGVKGR